ncbi:mucin-5AC-like [Musca domestica]|uniref:Mucin-5AC-like n=1 Tax=Musca domestica TaxID=7370 RepID=A0ABM3VQA9_MUSDO|nr:mucin-5AC-like [Musca domestica]
MENHKDMHEHVQNVSNDSTNNNFVSHHTENTLTNTNSTYINAYPAAPPPTPHCICSIATAPSTPQATAPETAATNTTSITTTTTANANSTPNTKAKENEAKGLLPHNSHINQLQINYFQFPPKALLLDDSVTVTSLSAPSLATTTAVALAAASSAWPSSSNESPTSAIGATGCTSANNSPKTTTTATPVIATSNMGRREIKRSNTSSSTTKSYDSGSDLVQRIAMVLG